MADRLPSPKALVVDEVDRRIVQLKIEREALAKETDAASRRRLEKLEDELEEIEAESAEMTARWKAEKRTRSGRAPRRARRSIVCAPETRRRPARRRPAKGVGDPLWRDPAARKRLAEEEAENAGALKPDPRWSTSGTGLPRSSPAGPGSRWRRCWRASAKSCCKMEDALRQRVVGQDEALEAECVSDAVRRARAGLKDPGRPIGSFLFLGPTGVSRARRAHQGAGRVPVHRRERHHPPRRHERVHGKRIRSAA